MCYLLAFLFIWTVPWFPATADELRVERSDRIRRDDSAPLEIDDIYEKDDPRSRMIMIKGNMHFIAGKSRNISFQSLTGGTIFVNGKNISNLPELTDHLQLRRTVADLEIVTRGIFSRAETTRRSFLLVANISKMLIERQKNTTLALQKLNEWRTAQGQRDLKMRKWMSRLMKNLKSLTVSLSSNPCENAPCQGGATCIPRFGKKYTCLCPSTRFGENCENFADHCEMYSGTHAGCQNNATCTNNDGTFECHCPSGYHGPLCQFKTSSCMRNAELCGEHGHCMDIESDSEVKYKCLCDWGFRPSTDKSNPTCVDVNECLTNPCHPGVKCINQPGSFKCSGCPKGYQGNGQYCSDIDECATGIHPCSLAPFTKCINTIGSYHCESCPPGYSGDGKTCTKIDICASNPCHELAACQEDVTGESMNAYICICPSGYAGNGIGEDGCERSNSTICDENNCLNGGKCQPISDSAYKCVCPANYLGTRCEFPNQCFWNPCQNEGKCTPRGRKRYFCQCEEGFFGQNCEQEENSCGVHQRNRTGSLLYPDDFGTKTSRQSCDIRIRPEMEGEIEETVQLRFYTFSGMGMGAESGNTDCTKTLGNVTIYDGDQDQNPAVATFCGEESSPKAPTINQAITMTAEEVLIRYQGTQGTFKISWTTVPKKCGYRISSNEGVITMPDYDSETGCEWYIKVDVDKLIELTVPAIALRSGDEKNCSLNSLEFFDGFSSQYEERILHICGSTNETTTIRSTGPYVTIAFRTFMLPKGGDGEHLSIDGKGFTIQYKTIEHEHRCGGGIKWDGEGDFQGTITSPNYGSLYFPSSDCTWLIDASGGNGTEDMTLKLEFTDFDVQGIYQPSIARRLLIDAPRREMLDYHWRGGLLRTHPIFARKCVPDYVHVFENGLMKHDLCNGNKIFTPIFSTTSQMMIKFHSDSKDNGRGFSLDYTRVCEKHFTAPNGTISPSNYPNPSNKPFKCTYIIDADGTHAIKLKVKYIGLRDATTPQCYFNKDEVKNMENYIEFSGGRPENTQLNSRYICAKYPFVTDGELVTSGGTPLKITYSTSGSSLNSGFLIEYEAIDVGCGGVFTGTSGVVASPDYPNKYLPHMHCVYQITVPWRQQVKLSFDNFELEVVSNDDCSYDHVRVYERYTSETDHGPLLGKFCGTLLPPSLLSPSYTMALVFSSDRSVSGSGFSAKYEAVNPSTTCDRTFTSPTGQIVFNGSDTRMFECEYHIALASNSRILLRMNGIQLKCKSGELKIRNGLNEQSPGFHTLSGDSEVCDTHKMTELRSHGSRVYLKLRTTDPAKTFFNISYEQIANGCGGHVDGSSGSVSAPQYPLRDSRTLDCEWNIAVAVGNKVRLSLSMVDDLKSSDENGFCGMFASNALDISDGPHGDSRLLRRFCKKEIGISPIISEENLLTIRYRQHGGLQFGNLYGFLAHFATVCTDIVHTAHTGSIQSPGYPETTFGKRYCTWTIRAPPGNQILIKFHKFNVQKKISYTQRMKNCGENYLKFDDDEIAEAQISTRTGTNVTNSMSTFCVETGTPLSVKTTSNEAHITFSSKLETNHFWLSWKVVGCGGDLSDGERIRITKDHLDRNSSLLQCDWTVRAPAGMIPHFKIEKMSIFRQDSGPCEAEKENYKGLGFYSGSSNISGFPQEVLCGAVVNQTYVSLGSDLFIRLQIDMAQAQSDGPNDFFIAYVKYEKVDAKHEGCSGIVQVKPDEFTMIHSPLYPRAYPRAIVCEYLFKTSPGYYIQFELREFTTANSHPQAKTRTWTATEMTNLTCKDPAPQIEGALTFHAGNTTDSTKVERLCSDTTEKVIVTVPFSQSLVTFTGAALPRSRFSGEADDERKIGFVLAARGVCGGVIYASEETNYWNLRDQTDDVCNITIRKSEADSSSSGIYMRIDNFGVNYLKVDSWTNLAYRKGNISISLDGGEWRTSAIQDEVGLSSHIFTEHHDEFRADNEIRLSIRKKDGLFSQSISISYSLDEDSNGCGGELLRGQGMIGMPKMNDDFECEWVIRNFPGSSVVLTPIELKLPVTEYCAESYLEIRKGTNSSGELVGRFCDGLTASMLRSIKAESIWIKLRYRHESDSDVTGESEDDERLLEDAETEQNKKQHNILLRYKKEFGGTTNSSVIELKKPRQHFLMDNWNFESTKEAVLIHFEKLEIPTDSEQNYGLLFMESSDVDERNWRGPTGEQISGWTPPEDLYLDYKAVSLFFRGPPQSSFRIRWESVPKRNGNASGSDEATRKNYTCGGVLIPTNEPQFLTSPARNDGAAGYDINLHCKWTIERPLFAGLRIKVLYLDLETHGDCRFDYIAFVSYRGNRQDMDEGDGMSGANRICQSEVANRTYDFTYNKEVFIHFVTDHSRGGSGFKIEFELICNSFNFIKRSYGLLDQIVTSFNYPKPYENDKECYSSVVLESNRRIKVDFLELDMEGTDSNGECTADWLYVGYPPPFSTQNSRKQRVCGTLQELDVSRKSFVTPVGRVIIRMHANKEISGKGYKIRLTEIADDCSADELFVDENVPSKTLTSPLFPKYSPNSLDCMWTVRSPNGHRLKFTLDPHTFDIQRSFNDTCKDDYLEIRDGATEHSKLIGKYCGHEAPSTLFSSGNYLHLRYVTDHFSQSKGFNATYEIATCGGTIVLQEGQNRSLSSPNFPEVYPLKVDCEWRVKAPNTHFVNANLEHLWVSWNSNCSLDHLAILDGATVGENATYLMPPQCNGKMIENKHVRSSGPLLTVQFHANNSVQRGSRLFCGNRKCGFELALNVSEERCGGVINDDAGVITAPGYPGRLLPNVKCEWRFEAGMGHRYELQFEFTEEEGYYQERYGNFHRGDCFMDLEYFNGPPEYQMANYLNHRFFCENSTTFVPSSDTMTLSYSDSPTRDRIKYSHGEFPEDVYRPFKVVYSKVPVSYHDQFECMNLVTSNSTFTVGGQNSTDADNSNAFYCHIVIRRPTAEGTTSLTFTNFKSIGPILYASCSHYGSFVDIKSVSETPFEVSERLCNQTFELNGRNRPLTRMFLNQEIELHVYVQAPPGNVPDMFNMKFDLEVQFQSCGGYITTPNYGVLTSPNFGEGRVYLPESRCQWVLEAPEGSIVKLHIIDMDIEADIACLRDQLILREGREGSVVQRYCHNSTAASNSTEMNALSERFMSMQSRSRYFTLDWTTDHADEFQGWRATYEFLASGSECGFISYDVTGMVHSPGFPNEYGNLESCIWDISVPLGYHVRLDFDTFDVQMSEECKKDFLQVSQEHHAQAWAPMGGYYFLFNQEEKHSPWCGIDLPAVFRSESNRIRLNFTTDDKTTARGFRATWTAECGTVFRLNHGVVTSPHYPEFYPNTNGECEYLIDPEVEGVKIITLRVLDFDLSPSMHTYSRLPCDTDYLEIRDVMNKRVVTTYCADEMNNERLEFPSLSIKGPVGVRFVTNSSFLNDGTKKMNRGFKLSFALSKCGDTINLSEAEGSRMSTGVSSPAFPLEYQHDLDCLWNITAPDDRVLDIKFEALDLESSDGCHLDFVEITDGTNETTGRSLGKHCGERTPIQNVRTKSNNVLIRFVSDRSMSKGGFRMVVTATLDVKGGCGGTLTATDEIQTLKPPLNELGEYYNDLRCGWNIKGPSNSMLELKLIELDTEKLNTIRGVPLARKCVDFLTIYDGYRSYSPRLASDVCNSSTSTPELPLVLHTSHDVAHVYFESDYGGTAKGFQLQYRSVKPSCGGWYTATNDLQSLNYESASELQKGQKVQRCQFVLRSMEQQPIVVRFSDFKIPSSDGDCSDTFLEIRDVGLISQCNHPACAKEKHEKKTIRYCGGTLPPEFVSNTMAVQITSFAVMSADEPSTFSMEYKTLDACNRTVDARRYPSGRVTSPNFPNPYDHNSTCTTDVQTTGGQHLLLVFRRFHMERGRLRKYRGPYNRRRPMGGLIDFGCEFDYVEVREPEGNATGPYCAARIPPPYYTNGSIAEIYMQSDVSHAMEGYDVSYFTGRDSFGGKQVVFSPSNDLVGAVSNIGHPGYENNRNMLWTIAPPPGHQCSLTISTMDLGRAVKDQPCSQAEYLELQYTSKRTTDERLQKMSLCMNDTMTLPQTLPFPPDGDRSIDITFRSDDRSDNNGVGFRITWECDHFEEY